MRAADLLTWINAAPFKPFRIHLNSGKTYDIRHPEMVKVGQAVANIYHCVVGD